MARDFKIRVTAEDATEKAIHKVEQNFARLTRGTPFHEVFHFLHSFGEKGRAFKELSNTLAGIGGAGGEAAEGLGEAAEGASLLGGAAGVAGLAVGVVGAGLAIAAQKAIEFENHFSAAGAAIGRTSRRLGIATRDLQAFQNAGKLEGVAPDAMTNSLHNLGSAMHNIAFAPQRATHEQIALFHILGMRMKYTKDGAIDTAAMMVELARVLEFQTSPQVKENIAAVFGAADAYDFLAQGQAKVRAELAAAANDGLTEKQIKESEEYQKSINRLANKWNHLLGAFSEHLVIPWAEPFVDWLTRVESFLEKIADGQARWNSLLKAGAEFNAFIVGGPAAVQAVDAAFARANGGAPAAARAPSPAAAGAPALGRRAPAPVGARLGDAGQRIEKYLRDHGIGADQARGIAAGIFAESKFDVSASNSAGGGHGAHFLGQWRGDRLRRLLAQYGANPTERQQLDFMIGELRGGDPGGPGVLSTHTSQEALDAYVRGFMRPSPGGVGQDLRQGAQYLASMGPTGADGPAVAPSSHARLDIHFNSPPPGLMTQVKQLAGEALHMTTHIGQAMEVPN